MTAFLRIPAVFLLTLLFCPSIAQPKVGLVASYPFDGNADDVSGNNYHGTVHGATLAADRFGHNRQAYLFDGKSYIDIPGNKLKNATYTFSVWVKLRKMPARGAANVLFSIGDETGRHQCLGIDSEYNTLSRTGWNAVSFGMGTRRTAAVIGSSIPELNKWYHLSIVRGKNFIRLYVDGGSIGETKFQDILPFYGDPTLLVLGARCNHAQGVVATLDDIMIYDHPLEDFEIRELYNSGTPKAANQ